MSVSFECAVCKKTFPRSKVETKVEDQGIKKIIKYICKKCKDQGK